MEEDLLSVPSQEPKVPEDNKADDPNSKILESLDTLGKTVEGIGKKVEDIDARTPKDVEEEEAAEDEPEHFRPGSWDDVPEKAREIAREELARAEQEKQEQEEERKATEAEQQKQIDTYLDTQIGNLEKSGFLQPVKDAKDENDEGRAGRRELYGFASRMKTMDLERAAEALEKLHESGITYDPKANNFEGAFMRSDVSIPGKRSPVGSSAGRTGVISSKPDYKDIANARSLDEIIERAGV